MRTINSPLIHFKVEFLVVTLIDQKKLDCKNGSRLNYGVNYQIKFLNYTEQK